MVDTLGLLFPLQKLPVLLGLPRTATSYCWWCATKSLVSGPVAYLLAVLDQCPVPGIDLGGLLEEVLLLVFQLQAPFVNQTLQLSVGHHRGSPAGKAAKGRHMKGVLASHQKRVQATGKPRAMVVHGTTAALGLCYPTCRMPCAAPLKA